MKMTTIRKGPRGTTQARPMSDQWPYRCSECGRKTFKNRLDGVVYACNAHPDADLLEWTGSLQACALYLSAAIGVMGWEAMRDVLTVQDGGRNTPRYLAALQVLPLLEHWGGLPERSYEHTPSHGYVPGISG